MQARERFLAAVSGEAVDRPPLWLMRQAGRYLPGYRQIRATHGFWEVCKNPALSTQVALEPLALFPLDAAIVFSDILVVPEALGLGVVFGGKSAENKPGGDEGPKIERPLRNQVDLQAWDRQGVRERLGYVSAAAKHLSQTLKGGHGLIGFAGAPFTLFAYMVEGFGSDDFRHARLMLHADPALAHQALADIADVVSDLLLDEFQAGVDIVQLFDTWGGLLSADDYRTFAVPALQRISRKLHDNHQRVLLFVKGGHHLLDVVGESEVDGLSLDWRTSLTLARRRYPKLILQGNFDPILLFAPERVVREKARALMQEIAALDHGRGIIVNLGHGILPGTPVESVAAFCDEVAKVRM